MLFRIFRQLHSVKDVTPSDSSDSSDGRDVALLLYLQIKKESSALPVHQSGPVSPGPSVRTRQSRPLSLDPSVGDPVK